ncbi:endo-1,4-beta-xylanase [Alteromonas sp. BMJM2]|uniref:endo-1,4-beta-xylanase n=1 Tax=Alteromonas sp. BMJM2 TaxID=2954241 RepID=UPI0022B35BBA|nr:endo-1,4-beta-xylanase [Alteromonas sp. BMJM2]
MPKLTIKHKISQFSYAVFFLITSVAPCFYSASSSAAELALSASPDNLNIPDGGKSIIPALPESNFGLERGDNQGPVGDARTVEVNHPLFKKAIEISVDNPNGQFWNGQVNFPIIEPLSRGDSVLLLVYFRMVESADETGTGFLSAYVESPPPDYTKYLMHQLVSSGEWETYLLPMTIRDNFDNNEIFLKFGFGSGNKKQRVQIANIRLLNFGNSIDIGDLPVTKPTYVGRELDAKWRGDAAARIEKFRKGDFSIVVEDSNAKPLPDAKVSVTFEKHLYHFGSVAAARHLVMNDEDSKMYRTKLLENFNQSGLENNLKWGAWSGEWNDNFSQSRALAALAWLKDHQLYTRGHVMVWPSKRNMPNSVQHFLPDSNPRAANPHILSVVKDHIHDISSKTHELIDEWDVLNEPFDNHYLMDAFGDQVMLDWFSQAQRENPSARLFINDYSIISGGGRNSVHQDHYFNTIDYLLSNDAPVHGIGLQSHFSATPTPITQIFDIIDKYHSAFPNLMIRATEFDIDTSDEQMQADYTRDFLTIFFSHPATVGVQKWGFWAGAHWRPNAAMYHRDWSPKLNQKAWHDTVYSTFWNDFSGKTDDSGNFAARGFYGDYVIKVEIDGKETVSRMKLGPDKPNRFTLQVE